MSIVDALELMIAFATFVVLLLELILELIFKSTKK
ncbi:putative holin-like toxin [Pediococcus argentinicus]|nr:putative holin-like toxin [Pediococcus argentinicus]